MATPPGFPSRLLATVFLSLAHVLTVSDAVRAADVLTQRNDNARTGASIWPGLNQQTVRDFRLLATLKVDGPVTAQPLFADGVEIDGVKHSIIFTATALNQVIAFDWNPPFGILWACRLADPWKPNDNERIELGGKRDDPGPDGSPGKVHGGYSQMSGIGMFPNEQPVLGIEATPVIDREHNRMFVSYRDANHRQHLAAIDIRGDGAGNCNVPHDVEMPGSPLWHKLHRSRASLLLDHGIVFVAFAALNEGLCPVPPIANKPCDIGDYQNSYQGWIHAFDAATLALLGSFRTVTDAQNAGDPARDRFDGGGIWQASTGLAADPEGHLYFATGNARKRAFNLFGNDVADAATKQAFLQFLASGADLSSSIVRLKVTRMVEPGLPPRVSMTAEDWFTPYRKLWQDGGDMDLGSGGVVLIPGTPFLAAGGKEGMLYLLDRNRMGRFDARDPVMAICPDSNSDDARRDAVVQKVQAGSNVYFEADTTGQKQMLVMCSKDGEPAFNFLHWPHIHGTPVFGTLTGGKSFLYVWPEKDDLKSFEWLGDRLDERPRVGRNVADGTLVLAPPFIATNQNGMPGGMLSLSIDPTMPDAGVLFASVQRCGTGDSNMGQFEPVECSIPECPVFAAGFFQRHDPSDVRCSSQMNGMLRAFDPVTMTELWNDRIDIRARSGESAHTTGGDYMFAKYVPPTIANGRVLLATDDGTVRIYGSPGLSGIWEFTDPKWRHLDDNNRTVATAAAGGQLYQLHLDGSIWRYTGTPCSPVTVAWNDPQPKPAHPCPGWVKLDNNQRTVAIAAGGDKLFQLHNDGSIHQFTDEVCRTETICPGWFPLDMNRATVAIAANDFALFQLLNDGRVYQSTGEPCAADGVCRGWLKLDHNQRAVALAAAGNELYQLHIDGAIFQWTGTACQGEISCPGWRKLDNNDATVALAAAKGVLYQLHNDGAIFQSTGASCESETSCTGWVKLDGNSRTVAIAAGGTHLYQMHNDGSLWKRDGEGWSKIDTSSRTSSITAADEHLYQLHLQLLYQLHDNGELLRLTSPGWQPLDRNSATISIAAAGKELYQLHNDGSIWRFTGHPCDGALCTSWELLDRNTATVAISAAGKDFFQLLRNGEVWRFTGAACSNDICSGWELIDDHKGIAIVASGRQLFEIRSGGSIWRYLGGLVCAKGACDGWEPLDRSRETAAIVVAGRQLFQLHNNGEIWRFTGRACDATSCPGWELLDRNADTAEIAASATQLIQRHRSGKLWRYTGRPCVQDACPGWEMIDVNPGTAAITVGGKEVYQMLTNGAIWRYAGIPCDAVQRCAGWEQLDGNPAARAALAEGAASNARLDGKPAGGGHGAGSGKRRRPPRGFQGIDTSSLAEQARRLLRDAEQFIPELEGR
jgi:alpha-tubulin suppressor-like RCC1 family protein